MAEKVSVGASDTSDETSIDTAEKGGEAPRRRGMRVNFKVIACSARRSLPCRGS